MFFFGQPRARIPSTTGAGTKYWFERRGKILFLLYADDLILVHADKQCIASNVNK